MSFIVMFFGSLFGHAMNLLFSVTNSYVLSVLMIVVIVRGIMFLIKMGLAKTKKLPKEDEKEKSFKRVFLKVFKTVFSVLQFFIFVGLFGAITSPISNILNFDAEIVTALKQILIDNGISRVNELSVLNNLHEYGGQFLQIISQEQFEIIEAFKTHFTFGSIDLTRIPTPTDISIAVPIFSTFLTVFPFVLQLKGVRGKVKLPNVVKGYFGVIMILSCFIGFILPVGVGLYLCLSKIIGEIETYLTKKLLSKYTVAQSAGETGSEPEVPAGKQEEFAETDLQQFSS